jgi:hypothetical protein
MIVQNHAQQSIQANLMMIDDLINGRLDDALQGSDCDLAGKEITSISPDGRYWTVGSKSNHRNRVYNLSCQIFLKLRSFLKVS